MLDPSLMRLQYEIFNTSIEQLAADSKIPVSIVQKEATAGNWKQLWPAQAQEQHSQEYLDSLTDDERGELLTLESEQYIETARKRMRVYTLAKDITLAVKYLELEHKLVDTAIDLLENFEGGAAGIKQLSALYKDLTSGSSLTSLAKLTLGVDEDGMPSVIIRDLTGQK